MQDQLELVDYYRLDAELKARQALIHDAWLRGLANGEAVSSRLARFVAISVQKACGKLSSETRHKMYQALVGADHPLHTYALGTYACDALIEWIYGPDGVYVYDANRVVIGYRRPLPFPSQCLKYLADSLVEVKIE